MFNYILDKDIQKKYYNKVTGVEEWRCRYYSKVYTVSRSISSLTGHLIVQHKIPRDSKREVRT